MYSHTKPLIKKEHRLSFLPMKTTVKRCVEQTSLKIGIVIWSFFYQEYLAVVWKSETEYW